MLLTSVTETRCECIYGSISEVSAATEAHSSSGRVHGRVIPVIWDSTLFPALFPISFFPILW